MKVFASTTVRTDNDAIQFFAHMREDRTYEFPALCFYRISNPEQRNWKTSEDEISALWDNPKFLIDTLYLGVVKSCKMGMPADSFDVELADLLKGAQCSIEDLKEILTKGIELGFFHNVECDFFK